MTICIKEIMKMRLEPLLLACLATESLGIYSGRIGFVENPQVSCIRACVAATQLPRKDVLADKRSGRGGMLRLRGGEAESGAAAEATEEVKEKTTMIERLKDNQSLNP